MQFFSELPNKLFSLDLATVTTLNQLNRTYFLYNYSMIFNSYYFYSLIIFSVVLFGILKRHRPLLVAIAVATICACLTDFIAYQLIKPFFARLRPCQEWRQLIELYQGCAGLYGFPSNHASNAMAAAVSLWLFAGRGWGVFGVSIAFFIGLARIFVGVHYPSDVLFGFAFGASIAWLVYLILRPVMRNGE